MTVFRLHGIIDSESYRRIKLAVNWSPPVEPFNYFHRSPDWQVIWFHDSFSILDGLLEQLDRDTFVTFSFSWFVTTDRLGEIFKSHSQALTRRQSRFCSAEKVLYLLNSSEEFEAAQQLNKFGFNLAFVNNACFLNTQLFSYDETVERKYSAVYNAKPLAFKRHYLTAEIQSKMFITYDVNEVDYGITAKVDLESVGADRYERNLQPSEVSARLNECRVGLLLSEEEGACYSSLEYLLCGLPVVSTPSRGGRAEYYNENNSIVANATAYDVAYAVSALESSLASGVISATRIRSAALEKIYEFRNAFCVALERLLMREGEDASEFLSQLADTIDSQNKMLNYRNFFRDQL